METFHCVGLFFSFLLIVYKLIAYRVQLKNLPPSPPSLPILGHFHLLKRAKKPLHHFFHNLSTKYGPIFFLRLGSRPVLVISTPTAFEECFTKNDIIFANRPLFASRKALEYNFTTLTIAPYGPHWCNLRRLTAIEIFSSKCLQMCANIRAEEIHFLVKQLVKSSMEGALEVETKSLFYMLTFNVMMKMVAGQRHFTEDFDSESFRNTLNDLRQTFSPDVKLAFCDHFPILRWFTSIRHKKRLEVYRKRENFLQDLINSCQNYIKSGAERRQTLIDVMLSMRESEPDIYTENVIIGIILMMMVSGPETSASTMKAAVSHLTEHPEAFHKAREEIDLNIGQSRLLDDYDLSKLPFLHSIINETIRLGSTGPIIPRASHRRNAL